jgi:penicillin-binding protein 2
LPNERDPEHGKFAEKGYDIDDTAPPGDYDFEKAFYHSSNSYFSHYGLKAGLRKLLEVAKWYHLGEKTGFAVHPEAAGYVPPPDAAGTRMPLNSTPYVAIGQEISVTPLQMTVMISAIANGGTLFWPRIVSRTRSPETGVVEELYPEGRARDQIPLDPQILQIIHHAMLEDVEHPIEQHPFANAYGAFHRPGHDLGNFKVAGKTGTAQIKSSKLDYKHVTWFDSYGPYENPRYAVVVMVVDGSSGGGTSAPIAEEIYEAIVKHERNSQAKAAPTRL